ncbi:MAG: hypothetical protein IT337_17990 [Thermomicrobiales bacterium]|nr:hypothetical protein [Thermomicrobiales bacterium]
MAGADIRRFSSDRRGVRANAPLAAAAGGFAALAETLILPQIILAYFVGQLTVSYVAVGFVAAIATGVWALGRLPVAMLTSTQRRKQPWALAAALVRAAALALLALVTFRADAAGSVANDEGLLRSFFICFVAFAFASGFASVPTEALIAKSIPNLTRARFYRQRAWLALGFAILGALVVVRLFEQESGAGLRPFALLFLAATVSEVAVAVLLASLREPQRVAEPRGGAALSAVRMLPAALGDGGFRRFLLFRTLLSLSAIVDPFLIVFALSRLGVSSAAVGVYVLVLVLSMAATRPLWATLAMRSGERAVLQVSALLRLAPPLLALLLPYLAATGFYRDRFPAALTVAVLFGIAFACLGAAAAGQGRGNFGYLAEFAPVRLRARYATLTNGLLAALAFAPVLGGRLVERAGYDALFLTAAVVALLSVFVSGALTNAFVRNRHAAMPRRHVQGSTPPSAFATGASASGAEEIS